MVLLTFQSPNINHRSHPSDCSSGRPDRTASIIVRVPSDHRADVLSRRIVNEYGGKACRKEVDVPATVSFRGATFFGSSSELTSPGPPASTRAVASGATRSTPRMRTVASTGVLPALTTFTITARSALSKVAVAKAELEVSPGTSSLRGSTTSPCSGRA